MRNIIKLLLSLIVFFSLSSNVFAAPSISNAVDNDDGTVSVYGTGFGTHDDFNGGQEFLCVKYTDWDTGDLTQSGEFSLDTDGKNVWELSQTGTMENSTNYAYRYDNNAVTSAKPIFFNQSTNTTGLYHIAFDFKMYETPNGTGGGKPFRLYAGDDSSRDNMYLAAGYSVSNENGKLASFSESPAGGTSFSSYAPDDTWHLVEIFTNQADNTFSVWVDGDKLITRTDYWTNIIYDPEGHSIDIGQSTDDSYNDNTMGYAIDNYSVNYTYSRTYLADAVTIATATKLLYLPPESWNDTTLLLQLKEFGFAAEDDKYIIVVTGLTDENSFLLGSGDTITTSLTGTTTITGGVTIS